MMPQKRRRSQRGSMIGVEFALIFLVFMGMVIGAMDFGQFLFIHQTLSERARAAVRYGIVNNPSDATSIQNFVLYGQASGGSVPTTPSSTDTGVFNLQRSQVTVNSPGSGTDDYQLTVLISGYNYRMYSPYIAGSYTGPNILASLPLGVNY